MLKPVAVLFTYNPGTARPTGVTTIRGVLPYFSRNETCANMPLPAPVPVFTATVPAVSLPLIETVPLLPTAPPLDTPGAPPVLNKCPPTVNCPTWKLRTERDPPIETFPATFKLLLIVASWLTVNWPWIRVRPATCKSFRRFRFVIVPSPLTFNCWTWVSPAWSFVKVPSPAVTPVVESALLRVNFPATVVSPLIETLFLKVVSGLIVNKVWSISKCSICYKWICRNGNIIYHDNKINSMEENLI